MGGGYVFIEAIFPRAMPHYSQPKSSFSPPINIPPNFKMGARYIKFETVDLGIEEERESLFNPLREYVEVYRLASQEGVVFRY